jgi:hypothetical protein
MPNSDSGADYLLPDYGGAGGSDYTVLRLHYGCRARAATILPRMDEEIYCLF